jgi:hypothetical protein
VDDRVEVLLRHALARYPQPDRAPLFAQDVIRRIEERRAILRRRRRIALSLAANWIVVAAACYVVMPPLPAQLWTPAARWALLLAAVPVVFAASLWWQRIWRTLFLAAALHGLMPRTR